MVDIELTNNSACTGCHACTNICIKNCISMQTDKEGFLYPSVDYNLCIKCRKCVDACPTINIRNVDTNPVAYACINKDLNTRLNSSSGGIFTLIADHILSDDGIVFGACFNQHFELEHKFIKKKEETVILTGSKYLQSEIKYTYAQAKDFLTSGRKVLFTGTPCQIAGLKSYLGKDYMYLFTIDIICHGVPSPALWKKYIEFRQKKAGSALKKVSFRSKKDGWKQFSVSFLFKSNTIYQKKFSTDLYMKAFLQNICLRPSCYECKFKGLHRQSDITLADFWGIENLLPAMDDDKGTSLVFVNSTNGLQLFNNISNHMHFEEVNIHNAVLHNPGAIKSFQKNPNREHFFTDLHKLKFNRLVNKYCSVKFHTKLFIFHTKLFNKVIKIIKRLLKR